MSTAASDRQFVSRPQRFSVEDLHALNVVFKRKSAPEKVYEANLLDFSLQGMKLRVPVCLAFEEKVEVCIEFPGTHLEYEGTAMVRHIRSEDDTETFFHVGCSISPFLSDEIIEHLAQKSGKERRNHSRLQKFGEGIIHRQSDTDGCKAVVQSISEGGFGAFVEGTFEPGESIKLVIPDFDGNIQRISARVCWQRPDEDFYKAGFSFSEGDGYSKLSSCVREKDAFDDSELNKKDEPNWFMFAAALFVMIAPTAVLMSKHYLAEQEQLASAVASLEQAATEKMPEVVPAPNRESALAKAPNHEIKPKVEVVAPAVTANHKTRAPVATQSKVTLPPSADKKTERKLTQAQTPKSKPTLDITTKLQAKQPPIKELAQLPPSPAKMKKPTPKLAPPQSQAPEKSEIHSVLEKNPTPIQAFDNQERETPKVPVEEATIPKTSANANSDETTNVDIPKKDQGVVESPLLVYPEPVFDPTEMREWKDSSGQFSVMASLGKIMPEFVVLRKEAGGTVRVPLSKLSKGDLEFLLEVGEFDGIKR